ncbi:YecA family protein [soil metagenome]
MQLDDPLSDKEFNELDQFLLSDRCPDDAMTMDSLHGFLTALVIGPETIPMSEWLPHVWGDEDEGGPAFKTQREAERIMNLIARFMNEIAITFEVAPKEYEPLFCQREWEGKDLIDGEGWAFGFWDGMNLRLDAWQPLMASNLAPLMRPFYLLGADEIEEEELRLVETPVQQHKLAIEIESNIPEIQRFWKPLRKSSVETVTREEPKVGRNDDCPCGSGKKFKKCCGQPTLH